MELMLMGRYRLLIIKIFGELDQHMWKIDISAILKPIGDPNERTRSV